MKAGFYYNTVNDLIYWYNGKRRIDCLRDNGLAQSCMSGSKLPNNEYLIFIGE